MNITAIYGSPRRGGNSDALANHLLNRLEDQGARISRFYLNSLSFRGCQGCMGCKTSESSGCTLHDDLRAVLDTLPDADVLVIASPVYFGDVSAQTKGFIDRIYSFYKPEFWLKDKDDRSRLKPGKKLIFLLAQGNPDETFFSDIAPRYESLLGIHGFSECVAVRGCGLFMPGDSLNRQDLHTAIEAIAVKIERVSAS